MERFHGGGWAGRSARGWTCPESGTKSAARGAAGPPRTIVAKKHIVFGVEPFMRPALRDRRQLGCAGSADVRGKPLYDGPRADQSATMRIVAEDRKSTRLNSSHT